MKLEIERKFLVSSDDWRAGVTGCTLYRQGYLCTDPGRTVRVRLGGGTAILAIKGASDGPARAEFEYPIPVDEATFLQMLACLGQVMAWGGDIADPLDQCHRPLPSCWRDRLHQ